MTIKDTVAGPGYGFRFRLVNLLGHGQLTLTQGRHIFQDTKGLCSPKSDQAYLDVVAKLCHEVEVES